MNEMRAKIIATARTYLGVPWHHQGRNRAGMDCAGLIVKVAQDLNLTHFDTRGYSRIPDGVKLRGYLEKETVRVTNGQPGDIMLIRFARYPQHLAIISDVGMIHTYEQIGYVVEHRIDERWASRVLFTYAYPGVN